MKKRKPAETNSRAGLRLFLAATILIGAAGFTHALREDELECEQAASVLEACCPGFVVSSLACTYAIGCGSTTYPDLALRDSQCITASSCDDLVANKVCDRAADAGPIVVDENGNVSGEGEVCP